MENVPVSKMIVVVLGTVKCTRARQEYVYAVSRITTIGSTVCKKVFFQKHHSFLLIFVQSVRVPDRANNDFRVFPYTSFTVYIYIYLTIT